MMDAERKGLDAAARRLAEAMKTIAGVKTKRGAEATHVSWEGDEAVIAAGRPEGVYGWTPIQAGMFENNDRHPLFGNKKHWYPQGRWPITKMTEQAALDDAVEKFADAAIPALFDEHGFRGR